MKRSEINNAIKKTEALLARHGIRDCFSAIVYTDEVTGDKSSPGVFLACAGRLGIAPGDCVVFEDYRGAVSGVRAAGMGLAAVYDGASARYWEAFKGAADFAAASLRDVL
jgi:beta-phosphoglucomutase-like phosphatase (HAD superfamily)